MSTGPLAGSERLIYVVGPSGAGKDTVLRHWLAMLPRTAPVHLAQRVITRARPSDTAAEQHEPVSKAQMARWQAQGAFALHWQANGLGYAVRYEALAPLQRGQWVVVNGSRGHLDELRRMAPAAKVVLITASHKVLAQRLSWRGRESAAEIEQRLQRAERLATEVVADGVVRNEGTPADAAAALHAWWCRDCAAMRGG